MGRNFWPTVYNAELTSVRRKSIINSPRERFRIRFAFLRARVQNVDILFIPGERL